MVANDTTACISIDMPAGPSEILVIADDTANPAFVASDLLSQAEHGIDSQVILVSVGLTEKQILAIEEELSTQAKTLPRVDIVRKAIEHSVTLVVHDIEEAMKWSNSYAPEHLILQVKDAERVVDLVENAGSVFIGAWTPESVGDYSAGVNHSLRKSSLPVLVRCRRAVLVLQLMLSSDVRLCQTVLGRQSRVVHEAHHEFESHATGLAERGFGSDAPCRGGRARSPSTSCQHSIDAPKED